MSIFKQKRKILITCPKGIPPFLKAELDSLGFPIRSESLGGVETEGTLLEAMKLNLFLRTGHRVLFLIDTFVAQTPDQLYQGISKISWEEYIARNGYLSVTSSVENPTIRDTRYANVKCKDAIVDRINAKCGQRPDSGPEKKGVVLFLYWREDSCSIYFDTSGQALAKRGYRQIPLQAPMQETLAAAVIQATGWNGQGHFVNPMCGSGTLAIEAALIGLKKAPGLLRSQYSFLHLKGFDRDQWEELRRQARLVSRKTLPCRIIATDHSPKAIEAAKKNAITAGVDHLIEFSVCDYSMTPVPPGGGVVILNPEYGERLGEINQLKTVYKGIGDFFKQKCLGYTGYIFTGNLELAKSVGLKTKRRIPFFNSKIECRLLEYELYEGSREAPPPSSAQQSFPPA